MRGVAVTGAFKKDLKRMIKRGCNEEALFEVVELLRKNQKLPTRNRDHWLKGNYIGRRECHIRPDWLLIYKLEEGFVILERTRTHTDLFD